MLNRMIVFLFLIPFVGFSQSFNLKTPDVFALKKELEQDNSKEIIYSYLLQEYKKIGQKKNVKKYEYKQDEVCAFEQQFYKGILYTINQCPEEGGINYSVTFPKTNRKDLMEWIEIMDKNDLSELENSWNTGKTVYRPSDEGVGCYYTIKETKINTIIEIWCGC